MSDQREDLRVRITKELLRKSLLSLMEEKPIGTVSVSDLCRHAGLNRGTFYKHYATPFDLLQSIQQELFELILSSVNRAQREVSLAPALEDLFRVFSDNADLCRVLLSENGDKNFLTQILSLAFEGAVEDWKLRYKGASRKHYELCYSFIAHGSLGVIRDWIAGGFKRSPSDIASFIATMTDEGMRGVLGTEKNT